MIFAGQCPPGARLVQNELARQLQTSVTVVREVLLELAGTGLVDAEPNVGFCVAPLDVKRLNEAYELRAVLDGFAARLCCQRAGREDLRDLRKLLEDDRAHRREARTYEEIRRWLLPERNLHARILVLARSPSVSRAARSFGVPVVTTREPWEGRFEDDYREHLTIVEALQRCRPDDAEQAARDHVHQVLRYVTGLIEADRGDLRWYL